MGIDKYATLSNGTIYQNEDITNHQRNHLRILQKSISRRTNGAKNRRSILDEMAKDGNVLSAERLSWYLVQLRREGKLEYVDGVYKRVEPTNE